MMQAWREQHPQEPVLEVERPKAAKAAAGSPEELVDFGGTLVPVEIAERRSFFSNFLQVRRWTQWTRITFTGALSFSAFWIVGGLWIIVH